MSERDRQSQMEKKKQQLLGCLPACQHASRSAPLCVVLFLPFAHLHPFYTCATVCLQSIIEIDLGLWQ